ncbi:glycosyltransferase [Echinicola sp. CAU 1574]|uniref:Glycosyltransferase n=1 Tax=Echinicola arenosa TaxID=2774144 RepID=A0ABR9AQZ0_9BACT|nr:glycosyltransferase [Echinicola arenosa]MBD8490039.1 glycosyltransferase [Echinicola arenosa]
MHIVFNPPLNKENKYIHIMVSPLNSAGFQVHELDTILSSADHFKRIQLVHLNWFENLDDRSQTKAIKSFFRKLTVLTAIRLAGKKLVWTQHNRVSHEKKTGKLSQTLTQLLIKWADAIIIHSEISRAMLVQQHPKSASKIHYIPHPDFIGSYGPVINKPKPSNQALQLLFLGAVKPYKNIELLIETVGKFGDEVELTIAGKPKTKDYYHQLSALAKPYPNVRLKLQFIPDEQLPKLIGQADLLILPYDLNSSLNSGTVILAFSYKKTVICPEIGTLVDMKRVNESFFSYRYQSEQDHQEQLHLMVKKAIKTKAEQPNRLEEMGVKMYHYLKHHQSKEMVGKQLLQVYKELLNTPQ